MKTLIKLTTLTLFILSISACGRTGDLERVKTTPLTMTHIIHTV
jgi:hypothetical protein